MRYLLPVALLCCCGAFADDLPLADPLRFADGRAVTSSEAWRARRAEILELFQREMYGTMPPKPEAMVTELIDERISMSGFAIRRQVRQYFRTDKSGPFVDWLVLRPRYAKERTPVIIFLNSIGALQLLPDKDLRFADGYVEASGADPAKLAEKADTLRGQWCDPGNRNHWPIVSILASGYSVMTACYFDIAPDPSKKEERATRWRRRCFDLWPADLDTKSLMAWAWGLCRGLDLAEREYGIDATRAVVTGCSRLGKAALLAGAYDERFAVVAPNQTGKGGVPLTRHPLGETIAREKDSFPHWFKDSYLAYAGRDREIPYDQHLLLACVAPRRLLVTGFDSSWFDTEAEYMACRAASPVWKLLGLPGLPDRPFPPDYDTSCVGSHVGYVRRTEQHGLSPYDWQWILGFAKRAFRASPPASRDFPITGFGAKPGEKATAAFAAAFAAAEKAGGGRVTVPDGTWTTGAIHFRSNCELHLAENARIEFTDDPADYLPAVFTSWEGVECRNYSPLVYACGCTNVALTGKGTLAPKMDLWREWFKRPEPHLRATEELYHWCSTNAPLAARDLTKLKDSNFRPHLVQFAKCRDVRIEDIRIRESPFWTIHLYRCDNCVVRGVDSYAHGHNNDGVDVESSENVFVEGCRFDQGDDGVVIKAGRNQDAWRVNKPTRHVRVRDVTLVDGHGLLVIGSEMSGGVEDVEMVDSKAVGLVQNLMKLKTNERRGGYIRDIRMRNCTAKECGTRYENPRAGSLLSLSTDSIFQWAKFPTYETRVSEISGVSLENCRVEKANHFLHLEGDGRRPARDIRLKGCSVGNCLLEPRVVRNVEDLVVEE